MIKSSKVILFSVLKKNDFDTILKFVDPKMHSPSEIAKALRVISNISFDSDKVDTKKILELKQFVCQNFEMLKCSEMGDFLYAIRKFKELKIKGEVDLTEEFIEKSLEFFRNRSTNPNHIIQIYYEMFKLGVNNNRLDFAMLNFLRSEDIPLTILSINLILLVCSERIHFINNLFLVACYERLENFYFSESMVRVAIDVIGMTNILELRLNLKYSKNLRQKAYLFLLSQDLSLEIILEIIEKNENSDYFIQFFEMAINKIDDSVSIKNLNTLLITLQKISESTKNQINKDQLTKIEKICFSKLKHWKQYKQSEMSSIIFYLHLVTDSYDLESFDYKQIDVNDPSILQILAGLSKLSNTSLIIKRIVQENLFFDFNKISDIFDVLEMIHEIKDYKKFQSLKILAQRYFIALESVITLDRKVFPPFKLLYKNVRNELFRRNLKFLWTKHLINNVEFYNSMNNDDFYFYYCMYDTHEIWYKSVNQIVNKAPPNTMLEFCKNCFTIYPQFHGLKHLYRNLPHKNHQEILNYICLLLSDSFYDY